MDSQTSNGAAFPLRAPSIDTPSQLGTPDLKVLRGVARTLKSVRGHCETLNRQLGRVHDPSPSSRPHSIHSLDRGLGRLDENAFFSDTPPFASTHHQTATLSPARAISNSPDALVSWLRQLLPRLDALTSHLTAYPTLLSSLHNHAKRLDVLENASFSNGPFEDVTERLELIDGRVTEAEGKLDDHEKWRAVIDEEGLVDHGRPERGPAGQLNLEPATRDQSFASHGSSLHGASAVSGASSALAATTMECTHLLARVATLETMVIDLQSAALPSVARPWHLEVVVLPWGRHLRNVWQPVNDPNQKQSTESDGNDAWTSSRSFTGMSANLTADKRAGWDGAAIRRWADGTNAWMSARAPGVKSAVFQRLRSRGLVQNVRIAGNSARDVRHAIETTFADTLKILRGELGSEAAESVSQDSEKAAREGCLGIWAPFIPLRKIHKDSRLQFLTRDEMSTSTLWTAEFLASSVVMKMSGQWRLYITHRQGYLQELGDDQTEWTWARLRQLTSRAAPDQVGADEEEEKCWKWDPRLDPSSSVESSFVSDLSHSTSLGQALPIASAMGGRTIHQAGSSRSPSPVVYPRTMPISPLSEFVSQPRRTVSVPLLSDTRVATLTPNHTRRVVSHETGPAPKLLIKRRRTSFSPSSTPKRLKSPSPFFSEITWGDARSQAAGASNVKRSGTPFAYATPHSGPVQMDHRETGDEGNSLVHAHTEEPTWEGVNDVDDDDDENEEEHEHEEEEEEKSSAGTSLQRGSA
ncbi:MAG: hypothetical protein M1838_004867 [Thelocarpon superellum]|nr:MAG: hypothetical protein M1838_004867 [Thelocarpon superellum]